MPVLSPSSTRFEPIFTLRMFEVCKILMSWNLDSFDLRHCAGDRWNALFRYTLYLRAWPHGCDSQWIKGRPRKHGGGWHQHNCHVIARVAAQRNPTIRQGSRTSRFDRWVQQGQLQREKLSPSLEQPETLQQPGVMHKSTLFLNGSLNATFLTLGAVPGSSRIE